MCFPAQWATAVQYKVQIKVQCRFCVYRVECWQGYRARVSCKRIVCGYHGLVQCEGSLGSDCEKGSDNRYLSAVCSSQMVQLTLRKDNMCCAGIMESALRRYPPTIKMFFRLKEQRSFPFSSNKLFPQKIIVHWE